MFQIGLIGFDPDQNVGFGNISFRYKNTFVISGTQTGDVFPIEQKHFSLVTSYDYQSNEVHCKGPLQASSESLTHAAIYEADNTVNSIIHIHSEELWNEYLNKVPTTRNVPYGTPEMAEEMFRLFRETDVKNQKVILMAGHHAGIITFGNNAEEAGRIVLDLL